MGLGFLLSYVMVRISVLMAHQHDILARPSERGSHSVATPRLGGVGVALTFLVLGFGVEQISSYAETPGPWFYASAVAAAWAFVGGLLDDILDLPAANKFLFQSVAALALIWLGGGLHQIALPGLGTLTLSPVVGALITFGLVIFWINAFNFMDGMDGHAAGFAAVVGLGLAIPILNFSFLSPVILLSFLLVGSTFALFVQNSPGTPQERKTFMGDGGSHFIGLIIIALIIAASQMPSRQYRPHVVPLPAGLILLFPFIYDVAYTLLRRLFRGENILKAHRSHLYQRLLVAGWSHAGSLLLSMVTWFGCFALCQVYTRANLARPIDVTTQLLCLASALIIMLVYTMIVIIVEAAATKRQSESESYRT
jgi:UDP-N-acetylmuramyl pentapeptide phosphotransferase/UDP-N-acetylglucosamine-1-phosphate transferase